MQKFSLVEKQSEAKAQTLDGLDALDEVVIDSAKNDYDDIDKNLEREEREAIMEDESHSCYIELILCEDMMIY